jgi:hypothetical protein
MDDKMKKKIILSEQFQNPIGKILATEAKLLPLLTHMYMTAHSPGLVQTLIRNDRV